MFHSVIETVSGNLDIQTELICTVTALILGIAIAAIYMFQEKNHSKNYILTLALLPALVQVVIMLVNGNLGTSVAVMGAFSLVRFRSLPGNSKEIMGIFFAMVVGLATGMGYVTYAVVITVIIGAFMVLLSKSKFGEGKETIKDLKITIAESLSYTGLFDDLFAKYTAKHRLCLVKTTNMGSMYELQYRIELKDDMQEKEFIDELRCRNGNLPILCGRKAAEGQNEL